MNIHLRTLLLAVAGLAALPQISVEAATWIGGTGDYGTAANWDTGVVPTDVTEVNIGSGQATTGSNWSRAAVSNINGTGQLIINARFLNAQNGSATVNVADSGSLTVNGQYFIVAQGNTTTGVINQTGGTINATIDRGVYLSDNGDPIAGGGTINALGGVMNITMTSTDANASLHNFQAGRRGADDTLRINGGDVNFEATNANHRMYFSQNALLDIQSGTFDTTNFEYFVVGYGSSVGGGARTGNSHMVVNGGTSNIGLTSTGAFVVSDGQDGTVEIQNGSLTVNGKVIVGGDVTTNNGTGNGLIVQTGGQFTVTGNLATGVAGPGTYVMKGGTLNAASLSGGTRVDSFFAYYGGTAVLDGNVQNIVNESWFAAPFGANASYNAGTDKTTITGNAGINNLKLEVNTQTGEAKIINPNASFAFDTSYYEILSPGGALSKSGWNSLDDQTSGGSPDGDYNGDSVVNLADYTVWRDTLGTSVVAGQGADGNHDGKVDSLDYGVWKSNFGSTGAIDAGWTEAGGSNANQLIEYTLEEDGYTIAGNTTLNLGTLFNTSVFGAGNNGDIEFSWQMPGGYLVTGEVVYVGSGALSTVNVPEPGTALLIIPAAFGLAQLLRSKRRQVR